MKINIKHRIEAPAGELWPYLADFSNIYRFNPMVKRSKYISDSATCEIGSTRRCDTIEGGYIHERITDLQEGKYYTVEIVETSLPMKEIKATLGLNPISENATMAYMDMEMHPKYKILSPMLYVVYKFFAGPGILRGLEKLYRKEQQLSNAKFSG